MLKKAEILSQINRHSDLQLFFQRFLQHEILYLEDFCIKTEVASAEQSSVFGHADRYLLLLVVQVSNFFTKVSHAN